MQDYTWQELTKAVTRFSSTSDAAARDWLAEVETWAAGLRSSFPVLVTAAHRAADGLTTDELRRHSAARFLFQARAGRLDETGPTKQCSTPRKTIDLATALGLPVADAAAARQ
ncbi:hypothetical protein AB0L06_40935 [Spirillospora sp. NPDC052269]